MCISPINIQGQLVPCGKCPECRRKYQNSWAVRCDAEAKDWKYTYMLTLTYSEEHVPTRRVYPYYFKFINEHNEVSKRVFSRYEDALMAYDSYREYDGCFLTELVDIREDVLKGLKNVEPKYKHFDKEHYLHYLNEIWPDGEVRRVPEVRLDDVQRFFKRLRRHLDYRAMDSKMKYMLASEYGTETLRPHYHAIIFSNETLMDLMPAVKQCWDLGFTELHQIVNIKDGHVVDKMAAFMYAAKYISKPAYVENPYALCGVINPTFHKISKGLGKRFRDDQWKKFVDSETKKEFDSVEKTYRPKLEELAARDRETHVFYKSTNSTKERRADGHLWQLFDKEVTHFNGIQVQTLLDYQNQTKYFKYMNEKTIGFGAPRYFTDIFKPWVFVNEFRICDGAEVEKTFKRIDSTSPWYVAYKAYVEYINIRSFYNDCISKGLITEEQSRRSKIRYISTHFNEVDSERVKQALRKEYEGYASRKG